MVDWAADRHGGSDRWWMRGPVFWGIWPVRPITTGFPDIDREILMKWQERFLETHARVALAGRLAGRPRIQSVPSVPDADFPDWWAKHRVLPTPPGQAAEKSAEWWEGWRAASKGLLPRTANPFHVLTDAARGWLDGYDAFTTALSRTHTHGAYPPDSIPGAIASDLARMGALTGDPT